MKVSYRRCRGAWIGGVFGFDWDSIDMCGIVCRYLCVRDTVWSELGFEGARL